MENPICLKICNIFMIQLKKSTYIYSSIFLFIFEPMGNIDTIETVVIDMVDIDIQLL